MVDSIIFLITWFCSGFTLLSFQNKMPLLGGLFVLIEFMSTNMLKRG